MQPVAQPLHVGELLVDSYRAVGITFGCFPGIVNIDIGITIVGKSLLQQSLGATHHPVLGDAQAPAVPAVPAHGRRESYLAAHTQGEPLGCFALCITRLDGEGVASHLVNLSAQRAIVGIQSEPLGQILGAVLNRLIATHAEAKDYR